MKFKDLIRASKNVTRSMGPEFWTDPYLIEIDITYQCNLLCYNCDRSCTQAPDNLEMTVSQIGKFIDETISHEKVWRRIRILGGEPFLHPDHQEILKLLSEYKKEHALETMVEVVSNGYGPYVRDAMTRLPDGIIVKNTKKTGRFQKKFEAFNIAPRDQLWSDWVDFSNACWATWECGIGLNPFGYYPCAAGASIDRVFGFGIGKRRLPKDNTQFISEKRLLCSYCGHFQRRRFVPIEKRTPVIGEPQSMSWKKAYSKYQKNKPVLNKY